MSEVRVSVPSTSKMTNTRLTQDRRRPSVTGALPFVYGGVSTTVEIGWASGANPELVRRPIIDRRAARDRIRRRATSIQPQARGRRGEATARLLARRE